MFNILKKNLLLHFIGNAIKVVIFITITIIYFKELQELRTLKNYSTQDNILSL